MILFSISYSIDNPNQSHGPLARSLPSFRRFHHFFAGHFYPPLIGCGETAFQSSPSFIQHCLPLLLLTINAIRIGSRAKIRTRRTQEEKKLLSFLNEGRMEEPFPNFLRRSTYAECGCCKRDNSLNIPPHMREPACLSLSVLHQTVGIHEPFGV